VHEDVFSLRSLLSPTPFLPDSWSPAFEYLFPALPVHLYMGLAQVILLLVDKAPNYKDVLKWYSIILL